MHQHEKITNIYRISETKAFSIWPVQRLSRRV